MHFALVRRTFLALLLLTLFGGPNWAAAETKDAPQLPRVLLHINAQESLQDEALGLSILLGMNLDASQAATSIGHFEILKSAQKAKLLRKGDQLLARDLAFLALSTQAQKAVLGYLERGESGLVLRLNAYSAEKGSPLASLTLKETALGTEELVARAQEALVSLLGLSKDSAWPKNESTLDWAQLKLAGQGMRALSNGDTLNGLVLLAVSKMRNPIGAEQARLALKQGAIPTEPPHPLGAPERAVLSQLASEPAAAMRAYEAQLKTPAAKALAPAYAALLLGQRQAAKAQARLLDDAKASDADPLRAGLLAQALDAQGKRGDAAESAARAIKLGNNDYVLHEIVANGALAHGERKEAAKAFVRALKSAEERGASSRLAQKSIGWLRETQSDDLLDALPIEAFDENLRSRLDNMLGERGLGEGARLTAKARLALAQGKKDDAARLFEEAAQAAPDSLTTQLHAGRFFLSTSPNLDKSLRYLQSAFRIAPNNTLVMLALVNAYVMGDLFDKAQGVLEPLAALWPNTPYVELRRAEIAQGAKNPTLARDTLSNLLKVNEEYIPAIKLDAQLAKATGDAPREKAALDLLASLEAPAGKPAANAQAPKAEAKPAQPAANGEAKAKEEKRAPQVKIKPQNLAFSVNAELLSALPKEIRSVTLINLLNTPGWAARPSFVNYFFSPFLPDAAPLGADLARALNQSGLRVEDNPALAKALKLQGGVFGEDSLNAVLSQTGTEAVLLYSLSPLPSGGYQATAFGYKRGDKEVLQAMGEVVLGVSHFNVLVLILPLLLVLAVAAAVVLQKRRGRGGLTVQLLYDESFEDGYFAVRLSRHPLKQAFNVEPLMKKRYTDNRADTERKIRSFFHSYSPYRKMAERNQAAFSNLLPGHYFVYVTGLMVNLSTRAPIGNYELWREVDIQRDTVVPLTVNLVMDQCFVELRVLREVTKKKKVREVVNGKGQIVEKDVLLPEEAVGVTVVVNDDPTSAQTTVAGRWLSYDFPAGVYRIVARFEELLVVHDLVVDNTAPKQIELMLKPRAEMEHALTAPLPEAPVMKTAPAQTAPAQTADTEEHAPLELEVTTELLGEDLPPLPETAPANASSVAIPMPRKNTPTPSLLDPKSLPKRPVAPRMPRPRPPGESAVPSRMEIDELFESVPENWQNDGLRPTTISETERLRALDNINKLRTNGRYDEAAEICIRLGDYERAAELCQRGSNQILSYKVYGLNYLKQGAFREAAEMFKSAQEPLLLAQALEGLRLFDEANRQRGSYYEARGDLPRAIEFHEKAGAFDRVGLLQERERQYAPAGEAYFKARLYAHAAECFTAAGDLKRAAEAYEMDAQFLKAADLYGKLGSHAKVCALWEKAGRFCEAAEGFKRLGLHDEALHACQQVRPDSPEYLKAALIMGTIFIERGEQTMARGVYHRVIENAQFEPENIERYYEFGVLIQEQGNLYEANRLFELLQSVKYNYADITIRLQHLNERIANSREADGTPPPPPSVPDFQGYKTSAGEERKNPSQSALAQVPKSSRYVFERELGRGAMGIVFRARDTLLDRVVAYKTVSGAIKENPTALRYFLSEAKSLAALNHPNIVTVYDVGQENGNYFITMELIEGRSLNEFIRDKGRLTMKNCVVVALKLCSALEYAHSHGVVHRDIKPSNIMLSNQGEVKIMDFGLAKIMGEAIQDRANARGTPLYMSPEQVENQAVDARSDLYSLGVTLFEMATGTLPFTKGDIAYHHAHTPPPPPSRYNPSIPESLERIILKSLEKSKEERYQSAKAIKNDLAPLRNALLREITAS